jgi:hypothetical protein
MTMDNNSKRPALTLKIDRLTDSEPVQLGFYVTDMQSFRVTHPEKISFNAQFLENELVALRSILSARAKRYDSFLKESDNGLECDAESIKEVWKELAQWGRQIYRSMFDNNSDDLTRWANNIKNLKGSRLVINSTIGNIPWGLLYDEEVPEVISNDYLDEMIDHFWGTSYELEVLPPYPRSCFNWKPQLNNNPETRLTVTINKDIDTNYNSEQMTFFLRVEKMLNTSADPSQSPIRINVQKQEVFDSIRQRHEPQHLLYFFCHHRKGDGVWKREGWREFFDTFIVIEGEDSENTEAIITIREISRKEDIKCFKFPPVVFFNACESAQIEFCDPRSFMFYFIKTMESYAFIGAEALVPTAFADHFGRLFVKEFLKGRRIGSIMFDSLRHYARSYKNPFGLYYTLHGNGDVRLVEPVERVTL